MKEESKNTQMQRGVLELCILAILAGRDAYTNDLVQALKAREMIVVEGALYPLLARLRKQAYLDYRWEESTQGPPRKYYCLTPEGRFHLKTLTQAWREMVSTVDALLDHEAPTNENAENQKESHGIDD